MGNRRNWCWACYALANGIKSRVAPTHTCGITFKSCDCGPCKAKKEGREYKGPVRGTCLELKYITPREEARWEEERLSDD